MFNKTKGILPILLLVNLIVAPSAFAVSSQEMRSQHSLGGNVFWHPTSLVIPSAKGANISLYASSKWAFDVEFSSATLGFKFIGIEVADVNERKLALQARRFVGNSFNMIFGVGHRTTETTVPDNWIDFALGSKSKTLSKMEATYIKLGLANQWQFGSRYTFMVDWINLEIPVDAYVTESAADSVKAEYKDDVTEAESLLRYLPSGGAIKLQVGVLF